MTNVYFISDGMYTKIGKSKDIERRKTELQTANGKELKVLYVIEEMEDQFEKNLHEICRYYNINGEWFDNEVIGFLLQHPWYKENMKMIS